MLRLETETGWLLITHPDHAHLAGDFAEAWGNEQFRSPEPRARVLKGISCHDDGWVSRDAHPVITREGKPSAFSAELVGKYSAFEEIELDQYLAVRQRAVQTMAVDDPYAALLVLMHTFNLLTQHADRSTIAQKDLPLLDRFLEHLQSVEKRLRATIAADASLREEEKTNQAILENFHLLQACDNLSLLSCVAYAKPANLLHPLPLNGGGTREVLVQPLGPRNFRLTPWPYSDRELTFLLPVRHVEGKTFKTSEALAAAFGDAEPKQIPVTLVQ
ncbi:MAG: DUF3891 family protein [Terracidiphilus sp.]